MHRTKMKHLFDMLDTTNDGEIDLEEFLVIAENHTVRTWLGSMELAVDDLTTLFFLIDADGSGSISIDELIAGVTRQR